MSALSGERHGGPRAVLVSGDRGAGKTTLLQQLATRAGGSVAWLTPPAGGTARAADVRAALEAALGDRGPPGQLLARAAPGSLLVIDDLDLWWERRPGGLEAIDEIVDLIGGAPDHVRFALGGGTHAVRLVEQLRGISRVTAAHIVCHPLTAGQLQEVVMARHRSTGLELRLGRRAEPALGPWARARLFDRHFEYSGGNVGYALRAWIAHVEDCRDNTLTIRPPSALDWDALDDLRPELTAALIALLLHRSASADKIERVTGRPAGEVRELLGELCGLGLAVQSRRRIVQLSPQVQVPVVRWLERRELA